MAAFPAFGQAEDVLRGVQAVVLGDVLGGTSAEAGMTVSVTARLRVRRVVLGAVAAGDELPLAWSYQIRGMWPREDTAAVRPVSGLWLLKKAGGGLWQPQPVSMNVPGAMGGVYLPAPEGAGAAEYYFLANADPQAKVAMEADGASISNLWNIGRDGLDGIHCDCRACMAVMLGYLGADDRYGFRLLENRNSADFGSPDKTVTSYISGYYVEQ